MLRVIPASAKSVTIHKQNLQPAAPLVSVIFLDWSVRESFHALDWLSRQNVPREQYELIWIELYNRVVPEVMEKADVVITCNQKGMYHKHVGYNIGLLHSKGQVITVCDSDAVFPPDFIPSIIKAFNLDVSNEPTSIVLMHYERRRGEPYPNGISDINELQVHSWWDLWPNVGACMSVRKVDAIRFGGFDEHHSFRSYYCGPYDLGWRLVNAGVPEIWHDESVCLYHFAHPHSDHDESKNEKSWIDMVYPHVDWHALMAVEAFSTGRLLPLRENPEVHRIRMAQRHIGTSFEENYARMTGPVGFTTFERIKLQIALLREKLKCMCWRPSAKGQFLEAVKAVKKILKKWAPPRVYGTLKACWRLLRD